MSYHHHCLPWSCSSSKTLSRAVVDSPICHRDVQASHLHNSSSCGDHSRDVAGRRQESLGRDQWNYEMVCPVAFPRMFLSFSTHSSNQSFHTISQATPPSIRDIDSHTSIQHDNKPKISTGTSGLHTHRSSPLSIQQQSATPSCPEIWAAISTLSKLESWPVRLSFYS